MCFVLAIKLGILRITFFFIYIYISTISRIFTFSLMERTSRILLGLEALPASLFLRFGAIIMVNEGFLNTKHCENAETNANSENARSRMVASSAGKRAYGDKRRWVKYWVRMGCWISPCHGPVSLGEGFETYKPFISLVFQFFFSGRGKPRVLNQPVRGHDCILLRIFGQTVFTPVQHPLRSHRHVSVVLNIHAGLYPLFLNALMIEFYRDVSKAAWDQASIFRPWQPSHLFPGRVISLKAWHVCSEPKNKELHLTVWRLTTPILVVPHR